MEASERRIGIFIVNDSWLRADNTVGDRWKKLLPDFAQMAIVRAERLWALNGIEYTAISDIFEPSSDGEMTGRYEVQVRLSPLNEIENVRAVRYEDIDSKRSGGYVEHDAWRSLIDHY